MNLHGEATAPLKKSLPSGREASRIIEDPVVDLTQSPGSTSYSIPQQTHQGGYLLVPDGGYEKSFSSSEDSDSESMLTVSSVPKFNTSGNLPSLAENTTPVTRNAGQGQDTISPVPSTSATAVQLSDLCAIHQRYVSVYHSVV